MGEVFQLSTSPIPTSSIFTSTNTGNGKAYQMYMGGIGAIARADLRSSAGPFTQNGKLVGGILFFGPGGHVFDTKVKKAEFKHELVHTLNFGHGTGPVMALGLMSDTPQPNVNKPTFGSLTADEVAHIQFFHAVRRLERQYSGTGIEAIDQGSRVAAGLPIEKVLGSVSSSFGTVFEK